MNESGAESGGWLIGRVRAVGLLLLEDMAAACCLAGHVYERQSTDVAEGRKDAE